MKKLDRDELIKFLSANRCSGVRLASEDKAGHFERNILFEVYGQTYTIEWWNNQNYLRIGDITKDKRLPFIPFRYVVFDSCMPIIGGNENLTFFDKVEDLGYMKKHPFGSFRIPLPKKEQS